MENDNNADGMGFRVLVTESRSPAKENLPLEFTLHFAGESVT
jgi:hypothetical protein